MRLSPTAGVVCTALAGVVTIAALVWAPPAVSLLLAVATAFGWCAWLDGPPLP